MSNENQVNTCAKQRASSQTVGESRIALEIYFGEHAKDVWERLDESRDGDHIFEHVPTKIDCKGSEALRGQTSKRMTS